MLIGRYIMSLAKSHYNVHEHLRCGLGLVKDIHEWMVFGFCSEVFYIQYQYEGVLILILNISLNIEY